MESVYDDLLKMEYSGSSRQKMPMAQRAKIFLPFAALKGYEEAIQEKVGISVMEAAPKYGKADSDYMNNE